MTMIRKQFLIDKEKSQKLRELAARKGLSEADLIRLGVDKVLADEPAAAESVDWRSKLKATVAGMSDLSGAADNIERNKKEQAAAWQKRLARLRKSLDAP